MTEVLDIPVSVIMQFDHTKRKALPVKVQWAGREHVIMRLGFHHTYREGTRLFHVYSVATATMFLRLVLDTVNLSWRLTQVAG